MKFLPLLLPLAILMTAGAARAQFVLGELDRYELGIEVARFSVHERSNQLAVVNADGLTVFTDLDDLSQRYTVEGGSYEDGGQAVTFSIDATTRLAFAFEYEPRIILAVGDEADPHLVYYDPASRSVEAGAGLYTPMLQAAENYSAVANIFFRVGSSAIPCVLLPDFELDTSIPFRDADLAEFGAFRFTGVSAQEDDNGQLIWLSEDGLHAGVIYERTDLIAHDLRAEGCPCDRVVDVAGTPALTINLHPGQERWETYVFACADGRLARLKRRMSSYWYIQEPWTADMWDLIPHGESGWRDLVNPQQLDRTQRRDYEQREQLLLIGASGTSYVFSPTTEQLCELRDVPFAVEAAQAVTTQNFYLAGATHVTRYVGSEGGCDGRAVSPIRETGHEGLELVVDGERQLTLVRVPFAGSLACYAADGRVLATADEATAGSRAPMPPGYTGLVVAVLRSPSGKTAVQRAVLPEG